MFINGTIEHPVFYITTVVVEQLTLTYTADGA